MSTTKLKQRVPLRVGHDPKYLVQVGGPSQLVMRDLSLYVIHSPDMSLGDGWEEQTLK